MASRTRGRTQSINHRSIALPAEHGAWGFLLESLLLGLVLAPSPGGLLLCVATLAAFLIRQPLKIVLKDVLRRRQTPRTALAWRYVTAYGILAGVSFALVLVTASSLLFLIPCLLASPLVIVQVVYDVRSDSRALVAELCGAIALGAVATALTLLSDWDYGPAFGLWVILAARAVPSILYVRARLRGQRGQVIAKQPIMICHGLAVMVITLLAAADWLPWLSVVAMLILIWRAWHGLHHTGKVKASHIGITEMGFGVLVVGLTVAGFLLRL